MGGTYPVQISPFAADNHFDFLAELHPRILRGWGIATHMACGPQFTTLRRAYFGTLLGDWFQVREQLTMIGIHRFPFGFGVLPD